MEPETNCRARLLVVEDEVDLSKSLEYALKASGYEVLVAGRGETALHLLKESPPDLVLLDLMLPDISGLDICRQIHRMSDATRAAVIILSAKVEEADRIAGFEAGADDYVVKPFDVRELVLRIEARLRSRAALAARDIGEDLRGQPEHLTVGKLAVDEKAHRAFVSGREVRVSALEMRLILHLMRAPGRMCTRRELLTEVWGYNPEVSSRTVDTHVKRLRDKLGEAADILQTVRGVGFRLAEISSTDFEGDLDAVRNAQDGEVDVTLTDVEPTPRRGRAKG